MTIPRPCDSLCVFFRLTKGASVRGGFLPRRILEEAGKPMISVDGSVVAGIIIFLTVVVALNHLLFRPLLRVQAERESRTTGTIAQAHKQLQHQAELFGRYEGAIKNARMEGYRLQEQARSEALQKRKERLDLARKGAEELLAQSRDSIRMQVDTAKDELAQEAGEMARSIAAAVLRRSA